MRCAECNCENGDADCNWIASDPMPRPDCKSPMTKREALIVASVAARTVLAHVGRRDMWLSQEAIRDLERLALVTK